MRVVDFTAGIEFQRSRCAACRRTTLEQSVDDDGRRDSSKTSGNAATPPSATTRSDSTSSISRRSACVCRRTRSNNTRRMRTTNWSRFCARRKKHPRVPRAADGRIVGVLRGRRRSAGRAHDADCKRRNLYSRRKGGVSVVGADECDSRAGCRRQRIVVVTPPRSLEENPLVAAALKLLKLNEVYRIGGAQSIAALAYGTQTVPRVEKIVGPGNAYVQSAKRQVYGAVDIDMMAGPSEVAIIADETCDPAWIAADLLAQAEHDEMAGVWLITWSRELAAAVFDEVQAQLDVLDRSDDRPRGHRKSTASHSSSPDRTRRDRTGQSHCARTCRSADGRTRTRLRQNRKRGRGFYRTICADRRRRLLRRAEPRVADEPHRAILFAAGRCRIS